MAQDSYTRILLNYLNDGRDRDAKGYIEHALTELKNIGARLSDIQIKMIHEVRGIIDSLKNNQKNSAVTRAKTVMKDFTTHVEPALQKQKQSSQDGRQTSETYMHGGTNPSSERPGGRSSTSGHRPSPTYPTEQKGKLAVEDVNSTAELIHRSKMAGQAMRYNNPNIADLSDENRPTKVAEKYSELYDNEWTEAYEALIKRLKDEKFTIEILLCIIEEAYKYCKHVADKQIIDIEKSIMEVLSGKKDTRPVPKSEGLLLQYRKSIAALALGTLFQNFKRMNLSKIFQSRKLDPPSDGRRVDQYAKMAVELTWWMCVQDPPIHMCLHEEIQPSDYSSMFKAYTRTGKNIDFFVWPPIKLHKDGGLLTKGVMQFK
ncbi:hypothetical protein ACF0H5_010083 [Mactra antiquata]